MTYELLGLSSDQKKSEMSVADRVLEGKAFRTSLISDDQGGVSTVTAQITLFAEIRDRMGSLYEGKVSPISLARRILSAVATGETGRLFLWDMDTGQDYVLFLRDGYVTFLTSSDYGAFLNRLLTDEAIAPIDWQGPVFPSGRVLQQLAKELSIDQTSAKSLMSSSAVECVANVFKIRTVRISWVEQVREAESFFELPISEFVTLGLASTTALGDLRQAVEQVQGSLYPQMQTSWRPWFPVAASELFESQSEKYSVEEFIRLFKTFESRELSPETLYASILTFLSSGYLGPKSQKETVAEPITRAQSADSSHSQSPSKIKEPAKQSRNLYKRLSVLSDSTTLQVRRAFQTRLTEIQASFERGEILEAEAAEQKIYIEEAEIILTDPMTRRAYDDAMVARVDFFADGLAAKILADHFRKSGDRYLKNRDYLGAKNAFERSVHYEALDDSRLMVIWADFLAGEQSNELASEIIARMRLLEGGTVSLDRLSLYYGKVAKLSGNLSGARSHFNQAVELNKDNQEAWGELRILNTMKMNQPGLKVQMSGDRTDPRNVVAFGLFVIFLLYALANFVPSTRTEWPLTDVQNSVIGEEPLSDYQRELAASRRERISAELAESKVIPPQKRVWGNVEYYHLEDDSWFMLRRALLVFFGLVGMLGLIKDRKDYLFPSSASYGFATIALPYGMVVGFLTYLPEGATPLNSLILMGLATALAEQLFFFGFVARALLIKLENAVVAVVLSTLMFGLYQYSFFATSSVSFSQSALPVLQTTLFVGAACAWTLHRTKTLLNPLLLHVGVQLVLMLKLAGII